MEDANKDKTRENKTGNDTQRDCFEGITSISSCLKIQICREKDSRERVPRCLHFIITSIMFTDPTFIPISPDTDRMNHRLSKLVLFLDGTGKRFIDDTNIVKLFTIIGNLVKQQSCYQVRESFLPCVR